MLALGALWPLAILFVLLMLGRGGGRASPALLAVVALTVVGLFVLGLARPNLFEVRYMMGVVPLLIVLVARAIDRFARRRLALALVGGLVGVSLLAGLTDQQLNRSNPRLFDFSGVLGEVAQEAVPGDVLLFQPSWMEDVVAYYAPGVEARPLAAGLPAPTGRGRVFLMATDIGPADQRVDTLARVSEARARLARGRRVVEHIDGSQVRTWVYR
jgi:hypothetical protein